MYWSLQGGGKVVAWVRLSQVNIDAFEVKINNVDIGFFSCIGKKVKKKQNNIFKNVIKQSDETALVIASRCSNALRESKESMKPIRKVKVHSKPCASR